MEPSHREPDAFAGPVGRNQPHSAWSRTGGSTLLSAGTIKTATRNNVKIQTLQSETQIKTQITDLLYTNSSHGWFSGEAGLEVAQDFLYTLT